jgi:hypothetical protein
MLNGSSKQMRRKKGKIKRGKSRVNISDLDSQSANLDNSEQNTKKVSGLSGIINSKRFAKKLKGKLRRL